MKLSKSELKDYHKSKTVHCLSIAQLDIIEARESLGNYSLALYCIDSKIFKSSKQKRAHDKLSAKMEKILQLINNTINDLNDLKD